MRYHGLDLNLLTVLDALYTEQNVTRAALRLCLTQSAISAALGRLREHFNDPLFVSVGGKMVPTALMQTLEPRIRSVLEASREIVFAHTRFDPGQARRRFTIAASDYMIAVVMPEVQRRLGEVAPFIDLSLHTLPFNSGEAGRLVSEALEYKNCDFIIIPQVHFSLDHPFTSFFEDDFTIIAWQDNVLIGDTLSKEQYLQLPHVVREIRPGIPGSLEAEFLLQQGIQRRTAVAVDQFGLIPEFVVGSNRIATVHTRLARRYASRFPLRLIKPPIEFPSTVQVLQWHAYQESDPAVGWFRSLLQEVAASL
jgi:LysR family nod box-dependent transcriptional activator